jgi:hypothetical protein
LVPSFLNFSFSEEGKIIHSYNISYNWVIFPTGQVCFPLFSDKKCELKLKKRKYFSFDLRILGIKGK